MVTLAKVESGCLIESEIRPVDEQEPEPRSWVDEVEALLLGGSEDDKKKYNVKIVVGSEGKAFHLNRALLLLTSLAFGNLVRNCSQEEECMLEHITFEAFEAIVKHIYLLSEWQFSGDLEKACTLLNSAIDFGVADLVYLIYVQITDALQDRPGLIQEHVACDLFDVACLFKHDERDLKGFALDYIERHALTVLNHKTALALSEDSLVKILESDKLVLESELDAFKMLLRWGMHSLKEEGKTCDIANLSMVLERLLKRIRFQNMSQQEFRLYVQPTGILDNKLESDLISWWAPSETGGGGSGSKRFEARPRIYTQPPATEWGSIEIFFQQTRAELFQSSLRADMEASSLKQLFERELLKRDDEIRELKEKSLRAETACSSLKKHLRSEISKKNKEIADIKEKMGAQVNTLEGRVAEKEAAITKLQNELLSLENFRADAKINFLKLRSACGYTTNQPLLLSWRK